MTSAGVTTDPSHRRGDMRVLVVGLLVLMAVNGCAALKRTEDLPVPTDDRSLQGGPEGENDNADGL